jgi:prevent-host-death family protein
MIPLEVTDARQKLADTINRVAYGKERILLRRRGKDMAALVPVEDLALLEELEDRSDVEAARAALAQSKRRIPYEQARRSLGLK